MSKKPVTAVQHVSFKDFFEKSRTEPKLQRLVSTVFSKTILMGLRLPKEKNVDCGIVALGTLEFLAQREGIILTGKEEITAEYIGEVINSYGA